MVGDSLAIKKLEIKAAKGIFLLRNSRNSWSFSCSSIITQGQGGLLKETILDGNVLKYLSWYGD